MNDKESPLSPAALRGRALALLGRREHARRELADKLSGLGAAAEDIESLLNEFAERGWQDDRRFAEAFVREEIRKGHGPMTIRHELKQRGIDDELTREVLDREDWFAQAAETRRRKFGEAPPSDRKEQARQLRFLQYRGFSSEQCRKALRNTHG
jgi:regulatory protein